MAFYRGWAPYVPVAQRRRQAEAQAKRMSKKGKPLSPVKITGRAIASTFWGKAWCDNLENYSDYANRMPRGRSYARNGSIVDLQISDGKITALVSGSSLYKISIDITRLPIKRWQALCKTCSSQVTSLLELMRGKLPATVIERLTNRKEGMFPSPNEIKVRCSCPDVATMCKHVAAALYGVGHRLDSEPELFFKLRGVDRSELVSQALDSQMSDDLIGLNQSSTLDGEDLGAMFGIDLSNHSAGAKAASNKTGTVSKTKNSTRTQTKKQPVAPKVAKPVAKKTVKKAVKKKAKTSQ